MKRHLPHEPFPPYTYVPGRRPHPISDPAGHMYGREEPAPPAPDPDRPHDSIEFLRGVDLFNHGYYWEAHEEWEALWHACGRTGVAGNFLKGLIKLAAAGVKAREGNPTGVTRHARRAAELFRETQSEIAPVESCFGLNLTDLIDAADRNSTDPPDKCSEAPHGVPVFDFKLTVASAP